MSDVQAPNDAMKQAKRDEKLAILHKGPCSSPRYAKGDTECTCPKKCPLHGRCCDCIAHHKQERRDEKDPVFGEKGWMPHCLAFFDQRNGIGCEANPLAGSRVFDPSEIDWDHIDIDTYDFSIYAIDPVKMKRMRKKMMANQKEQQPG